MRSPTASLTGDKAMTGGIGKLSRYLLAGAGAIGILAVGNPEAKAADVQQLEATLRAMQAQMKELQREVASAKAAAASAQSAAAKASSGGGGGEDLDLKVKWRGAPEFSSADGKFKMKIRGRLDVDYNNIDQDPDITFTPDVSATQLRRARLGIEGVVFYDFKYLFEVDFAGNSTVVRDAYLEYTGLDYVDIRVGNFKTYNSLEHLMSANYITFMERPAFIEAFGIDRQIGGGLSHAEKNWTASAGIFGDSVASSPQFPWIRRRGELDLRCPRDARSYRRGRPGASFRRERSHARCGRRSALHPIPSARCRSVSRQSLRQHEPTSVSSTRSGALEAAGVWGPLSVQGEYAQLSGRPAWRRLHPQRVRHRIYGIHAVLRHYPGQSRCPPSDPDHR